MHKSTHYRIFKEGDRFRISGSEYLFIAQGDSISAQMLDIGKNTYRLEKNFGATFDLDALTMSEQSVLELVVETERKMDGKKK